jgi:hypothetical protein
MEVGLFLMAHGHLKSILSFHGTSIYQEENTIWVIGIEDSFIQLVMVALTCLIPFLRGINFFTNNEMSFGTWSKFFLLIIIIIVHT